MHIICSYSSIQFSCEHFPGLLSTSDSCHPIFHSPQKKLLSYLGKWSAGELTTTDSYLLFLAILRSTELVEFRTPAIRTEFTDAIVANNLETLARTVSKINSIISISSVFPHYVITRETRDLANVDCWIENWNDAYKDFQDGYRTTTESSKLRNREAALSRLILNPHKPVSTYAGQLADWAAIAGSFPVFPIKSPFPPSVTISCADYWKQIIQRATKEDSIFSIPKNDLIELIEHCEENIPVGSIHSHLLFKSLRGALERQNNFLGLGDSDLSVSRFQIITGETSTETANMIALINSAPEVEPRPEAYPNKLAYLKAKMRWDMAKKFGPGPSAPSVDSTNQSVQSNHPSLEKF